MKTPTYFCTTGNGRPGIGVGEPQVDLWIANVTIRKESHIGSFWVGEPCRTGSDSFVKET